MTIGPTLFTQSVTKNCLIRYRNRGVKIRDQIEKIGREIDETFPSFGSASPLVEIFPNYQSMMTLLDHNINYFDPTRSHTTLLSSHHAINQLKAMLETIQIARNTGLYDAYRYQLSPFQRGLYTVCQIAQTAIKVAIIYEAITTCLSLFLLSTYILFCCYKQHQRPLTFNSLKREILELPFQQRTADIRQIKALCVIGAKVSAYALGALVPALITPLAFLTIIPAAAVQARLLSGIMAQSH